MNKQSVPQEKISYVVGAERGVLEILRIADIRPLLRGAVRAGAAEALLVLSDGVPVCTESATGVVTDNLREVSSPLKLEGEPVGTLVIRGTQNNAALDGIASMLACAMDVVLANNLKRMLTTEMHTTVVTQTYDELLAKNRELAASESKYRELAASLDVQVRQRTAELEMAHARLLQQEKLASVGQLAAGMAHEINNPLGFITSNLTTLQKYLERFLTMLDWYEAGMAADVPLERLREGATAKLRELKIPLMRADVPDLLGQSIAGAERVTKIVADLKGYSHVDEASARDFDLQEELERALSVMAHQMPADVQIDRELKIPLMRADVPDLLGQSIAGAERVTKIVADLKGYSHVDEASGRDFDLQEELARALSVMAHQMPADVQIDRELAATPRVRGNGALFCQALSNLILNACQARPQGLRLSFVSSLRDGMVELQVADNGPGIPEAIRHRVFEPFFTTRDVGDGTGMGLTVVYDIITTAGGSISVSSGADGGACFVLQLPAMAEARS